jgi:PAS domain-containing protein
MLANPLVLRAVVVFFCSACAFLVGLIFIRKLRESITEEATVSSGNASSLQTLPLHVYNTVIQQLKQQKHELEVQTQEEQRRSRATENFSQAVLANLPCGVLVFGANGLIKQSNPAAREILGFASASGMSASDIFRDSVIWSSHASTGTFPNGSIAQPFPLADEIQSVLHEGNIHRQVEADYTTPGGQTRRISVTISPITVIDASLLGAACLITDLSDFESLRRRQQLLTEVSAEMALTLHTSLATISGYAQQLAGNRDPQLARQLAQDIADEATSLDRNIGGFLSGKAPTKAVSAGATLSR